MRHSYIKDTLNFIKKESRLYQLNNHNIEYFEFNNL